MDYQKAKDIREKSFSDMMVKNLIQGGGIGESFSKTISEKTQARVKGFKQAIDPMQIAKTLTFGSNLAPALLGKLTGRSSKDIKFFSGKKRKSKADFSGLANSVSGVSKDNDGSKKIIEVLGLIYRELDRAEEDRKNDKIEKEREEKTQHKKDEEYEDKFNQDLVKALTARFKPKKKTKTDLPKEVSKGGSNKVDKETPKTPKKDSTPKGATPKTDVTPKAPNPKVNTPNTPPKVNTPNTPPKVNTPKTPTPSATPTPTSIIPPIVAGGAATFSLSSVKAKIAGHESAGSSEKSYNLMNKVGPSDNNVFNLTDMTIQEVLNLADQRSKEFGKKGAGAAAGKYQFMPDTLRGYILKNGTRTKGLAEITFGKNWRNEKFSKDNQELLMDMAVKDEIAFLKRSNIPVSEAAIYMVHFLGHQADKIKAILYEASPDTPMSTILGPTASVANPTIASLTVDEYRKRLSTEQKNVSGGIKRHAFSFDPVDTGSLIHNSSKENVDLKESLNKDNPAQIQVNNSQSSSTQTNQQKSEEMVDDRPAIIKKGRK